MTEKEYRKQVSLLELTKERKEFLQKTKESLFEFIQKYCRGFTPVEIKNAGSLASGIERNDENKVAYTLMVQPNLTKNSQFMNSIILNEISQALSIYDDDIQKQSDIQCNPYFNELIFTKKNLTIYLAIAYDENGLFPYSQVKKRIDFVEYANKDYTAFRNTLMLLSSLRDKENIDVSTYFMEIVLYYGLNEYFFQDNRYENYLTAFTRALDDFFLEKQIMVSQDMYQHLEINPTKPNYKGYRVIDLVEPNRNLVEGIGEAKLSEIKKLKKAITKVLAPVKK